MKNRENELKILELISQGKDDISQRDISRIIGMSLGMTNSLLKRFAEKGLISIKKVNNRNIHYILTSDGMDEISRRSWGYFKRTIKNVVVYRDAVKEIINQAARDRYEGVILVGMSDLAFIVEHECYKQDVPFRYIEDEKTMPTGKWFSFMAETQESLSIKDDKEGYFSLGQLVMG